MASDFVFEEGEAIVTGSHGEHDFVFAANDRVTDTGVSDLVFEAGTGLGGGLQYEVNGGGLQSLEPISTAQTVEDFYNYQNASANHGYDEAGVLTVLVHENTDTGELAVVTTGGDAGTDEPSTSYRLNYSESIDASSDYLVKDGESGDEFLSDESLNGWNSFDTDGWAVDGDAFSDVTFTVSDGDDHPIRSNPDDLSDFRIIVEDGSTPDGGEVVYAGTSGSIRIVIP